MTADLQIWRLDCGEQTLVLTSNGGMPECVYWGHRLPAGVEHRRLAESSRPDLTGGMLDAVAPISLCPSANDTFPGQPGLELRRNGKPLAPRLSMSKAEKTENGFAFHLADAALGVIYSAVFETVPASGLIKSFARVETPVGDDLLWLAAPVLPAPHSGSEIIDYAGRWIGEFQPICSRWQAGIRMREARLGRSGHEHPPFVMLPETGVTRSAGGVYALHLGWSGGHRMLAEELPDGRRQIQMGKVHGSYAPQPAGPGRQAFDSGDLFVGYSGQGLNGAAVAFQKLFRDDLRPARRRPRPVHYNCWEAIYFNHDLKALCDIADRAAAIGAERFVLDDGWFGRRDNDLSSLGDWTIDRRKWPDGLNPLIDHVHRLGMSFGLWFEPEMVNPDSDLYRAHPDWALGPEDQTLGRHQMVLDMANPAVREYLFDAIEAVLRDHDIDYVKWDHNRQPPVTNDAQTRGTYELFARLTTAHPTLEIESCSSGGGRIDAGIMRFCGRVWLSDSNDALERLRMQQDAAQWLPSAVTGSHVGPRKSHTSGRVLPMAFRAWVAAQRHMGFEMDLRELTKDETATLTRATSWYRANRDWMHVGEILPLETADPETIAELQRAADGSRFVVFAGQAAASSQILPRPLRLTGLDPDASYRLTLVNPEDAPPQSRGQVALKQGPIEATGRWLMSHGIAMPVAWPATMWVVEGEKL
jgi:alpha-galactosidase